MIVIIQNFTLVSLNSTATSHQVELPFEVAVPSHPMHLTSYALNSSPSVQLESIFGCGNYLYFAHLLRNKVYYFLNIIEWLGVSYRLDAIRSPSL